MISLAQARALHLAAQGLLQPALPRQPAARQLRKAIARMQLLQIDTIHVVARSPYLVLFSRLGHYPRIWLEDALAHGDVFETWAHEACFAPIDDLLLHRAYNRHTRYHWGLIKAEKSHTQQRAHLDKLLDHIRVHGAVKSSDFERSEGQGGAWWGWKDEKRWLEALFATGELMVARRENFHRVYDLTQRVAPAGFGTGGGGAGRGCNPCASAVHRKSHHRIGHQPGALGERLLSHETAPEGLRPGRHGARRYALAGGR
jgi:uncharacterized protein YcaQ